MTKERIAEIRAMLVGISPAPWGVSDYRDSPEIVKVGEQFWTIAKMVRYFAHHDKIAADTVLIAAAPTVIAELLDEVEWLQTKEVE